MRTKLSSCLGKSAFASWGQAEARAKKMRRRGDREIRPYRCDYPPRHFHVGGESVEMGRQAKIDASKGRRHAATLEMTAPDVE